MLSLIHILLLAVALIPMAALPAATSKLYMASAAREQAALLAVQKLDELESKKFNDLSGGSQTIGGYSMVWTVGEAVDQKRKVKVSVTWNDGKSKLEVTRQEMCIRDSCRRVHRHRRRASPGDEAFVHCFRVVKPPLVFARRAGLIVNFRNLCPVKK